MGGAAAPSRTIFYQNVQEKYFFTNLKTSRINVSHQNKLYDDGRDYRNHSPRDNFESRV